MVISPLSCINGHVFTLFFPAESTIISLSGMNFYFRAVPVLTSLCHLLLPPTPCRLVSATFSTSYGTKLIDPCLQVSLPLQRCLEADGDSPFTRFHSHQWQRPLPRHRLGPRRQSKHRKRRIRKTLPASVSPSHSQVFHILSFLDS